MAIKDAVRRYAADVGRAFDRAPLECVLTIIVASLLSYTIETSGNEADVAHIVIASILVASVAWCATLARAMGTVSERTRWSITCGGGVAGCLYLLATQDVQTGAEAWRAALLVGGAVLLVIATPAWVRTHAADDSLRLRRINARFLLRAAGITLYGLALYAGLAVALGAINNLFELNIKGNIYGHVFVWIMVVLVPWVVIGGLDDYVRSIHEESDVARVVFKLATYLLPPLVALYFLILFAYVIRIAITHELPQNLVSPMVIAAGLLSCAGIVVFDPRRDTSAGTRWLRLTPLLFAVLTPLAWWAIHVRGADYGWTEFRLFRLVLLCILAVLALGGIAQLARRHALRIAMIPLVLSIGAILSAVGPWSIMSVARRSQQHRLARAFATAKLDPALVPNPRDTTTHVIRGKLYRDIEGASTYLQSNYGDDAVAAVVPAFRTKSAAGLASLYHLKPDSVIGRNVTSFTYATLPHAALLPTPDGTVYMYNVARRGNGRDGTDGWVSNDSVFIHVGADTLAMALAPVIAGIHPGDHGSSLAPPAAAAVPVVDRSGAVRGFSTVMDLSVQNKNGAFSVVNIAGILLLKGRTP